MKRLLPIFLLMTTPAFADACMDLAKAKQITVEKHGTWIGLTSDQWNFLRGVYIASSNTPDRLPFGSSAALASYDGGGIVFFIDGDRACDALVVRQKQLKTLTDIGAGVVTHEEKIPGENP